ncbi:CDP-glycerol glycerophosphotransferase family protein [Lactiplantibacillus sp. WILCCON 0030]|uniref:CDP-glycerol glycerophosphotransferase family protein n=1 Tax=Lactiplantibacillus brownii TaxID=3069269 RepID=A0ABU1A9Z1_9LACO|nr:CDP-glycerol glycerophosphotransferase family protein [Lactiplantibacillus brownii]MDQ7937736.1 CDP-glycerol glycerophosphotransferase family protein [Lactiplantibacillus brownii]
MVRNIVYLLSGWFPRSDEIVLFGAWFGKRYSDNPRYLLQEILESNRFSQKRIYWIGNSDVKPHITDSRITFVKRNSFKSYWYQLRAKKVFVSHGFQDIGSISCLKGAMVFQLWHGFPIKHIGADDPGNSTEGSNLFEQYQYFFADSDVMANRIKTAFKNYGASDKNVIVGTQPRVDYLQENKDNSSLKRLIRKKLNISEDATVYTYLPTFRDNSSEVFSFLRDSGTKFEEWLDNNNSVLLERQHFARNVNDKRLIESKDQRFIDLSEAVEVQDVLLITDYLITDYSSVYIDFLTLNRPIIHFLYDGDKYIKNDRGVYANDITSEFAGPVANNITELIDYMNMPVKYFISKNETLKQSLGIGNETHLVDIISPVTTVKATQKE